MIEIKLFLKTALPPSWDTKGNEIPASARPKMPPPIFGRTEPEVGQEGLELKAEEKSSKRGKSCGIDEFSNFVFDNTEWHL